MNFITSGPGPEILIQSAVDISNTDISRYLSYQNIYSLERFPVFM